MQCMHKGMRQRDSEKQGNALRERDMLRKFIDEVETKSKKDIMWT
jgi:hypothetical protein